MNFRAGLIVMMLAASAIAVAACGSDSSSPTGTRVIQGNRPGVEFEERTVLGPALTSRWGEIVKWRVGGAEWSIELPQDGWWDFVDPVDGSAPPTSATYRTNSNEPNIYVDVVRLNLANLSTSTCTRPTTLSPDGSIISVPIEDVFLDGYQAMVTRITSPASDGSTTGSYEFCFVTETAMYQIVSGTRPGSAVPDMFAMLNSFRLES